MGSAKRVGQGKKKSRGKRQKSKQKQPPLHQQQRLHLHLQQQQQQQHVLMPFARECMMEASLLCCARVFAKYLCALARVRQVFVVDSMPITATTTTTIIT